MIVNLSREQFAETLHRHLSPTTPIQSQEHLFGRDAQVTLIEQALYAPGRTVFVYGDRGVGKTSVAQTVAYSHQTSSHDPVILVCSSETSFGGLIRDAVDALSNPDADASTTIGKIGVGLPKLMGSANLEFTHHKQKAGKQAEPDAMDLNSAIALLRRASEVRKGDTVVVIDEFDRITRDAERTRFADFIKQIGDQRISIRFIFCGVAESLEKLLGAHESSYRYIEGVELPRLSWDARWEIIDRAAEALKVKVGSHPRFRIAAISDGFPHYVHLVCEKLFWEMFNDPTPCLEPSLDHYKGAVTAAVLGIEQHLRKAYDHATMKETDDYEEVLWAVADHSQLIRNLESIHETYLELMKKLDDDPMDKETFRARIQSLKSSACGQILASNRRGWYHFRENIVRGYVRLRAEEQGVELALDYYSASQASTTGTWRPRGARRSRRGMTARDKERMNNPQSGS